MRIIGVAPGLSALAYSVIVVDMNRAVVVDADVLHARPLSSEVSLQKRRRVHQLVLGVVFERHMPLVLSIGPPVDPLESPASVQAVEELLSTIAQFAQIRVVRYADKQAVVTALAADRTKQIGRAVSSFIRTLPSRDRRVVLATAAALCPVASSLDPIQDRLLRGSGCRQKRAV